MIIKTRLTHNFIDLKTDVQEDTIFKGYPHEANETIESLLNAIEDICKLTNKSFSYKIEDNE